MGEGVGEGVLSTCQSNPLRVDPSSSPSRGGGEKASSDKDFKCAHVRACFAHLALHIQPELRLDPTFLIIFWTEYKCS